MTSVAWGSPPPSGDEVASSGDGVTSSPDPVADWLADAALAACRGRRLVVLIDGRSGAGKTTLAARLTVRLSRRCGRPVQLVSLDDCYPGWDGLAAAAAMMPQLLGQEQPGYRRFDWARNQPAEWVTLSPTDPLVVEGAGCLTPASAVLACLRVWVDADETARKTAALARDGATFAPHWDEWAAQEEAHIEANHPDELADVTLGDR